MVVEEKNDVEEISNEKSVKKNTTGNDNSVFIGKKPFMNYVTGVVMQFTTQGAKEVIVKARGQFMSRAIDVAEVVVQNFLKDKIRKKSITTDSSEVPNKEGRQVRVSTIEITLENV